MSALDNLEIKPQCFMKSENFPPVFAKLNLAKNQADLDDEASLITRELFESYATAAHCAEGENLREKITLCKSS